MEETFIRDRKKSKKFYWLDMVGDRKLKFDLRMVCFIFSRYLNGIKFDHMTTHDTGFSMTELKVGFHKRKSDRTRCEC